MSIKIIKYTKSDKKKWDDFIQASSNGTIFHLRSFLSYHIEREFDDHSLIFKKNNIIIAIFPAARVKMNNNKILYSHPGASYGGFVYDVLSFKEAEKIIQLIEEYCVENSFDKIFFIPTPSIYSKTINDTSRRISQKTWVIGDPIYSLSLGIR